MDQPKSTPDTPDAGATDLLPLAGDGGLPSPAPSLAADAGPLAADAARATAEEVAKAAPAPPALTPDPALTLLEQRVRRLEDALAQLQQARAAERITDRPPAPAAAPGAVPAALLDAGKRLLLPPAAPAAPRRARLMADALADLWVTPRLFFDPRYHLSWAGRLVPPALLLAFFTSRWWLPFASVPLFGWLLSKVVDLVLAFALFKVLTYEARRYRETAPDLPPHLRL